MFKTDRLPLPEPTILGAVREPVRCCHRGCFTPDADPQVAWTESGWRVLCRVCRGRRMRAALKVLRKLPGVARPITRLWPREVRA